MRFVELIDRDWYCRFGKRTLDVVISGVSLIAFAPLVLAIAIGVRLAMGSPVFFRQPRPGRNERLFELIKFRTMTDRRDASGEMLPDAMRVTWLGKMLRATSLDELPELWNVIKGEMSLVGPRPLLVEYLPYYSDRERKRHSVRPGLTGLAQVSGRNDTTWGERFAHDIEYVDRCSISLDARIMIKTVLTVIRGDGGIAPIERLGRFRGSQNEAAVEAAAAEAKSS